jgi:glycosyltransferase involved in cell wall biosynthesis
VTRPPRFQKDQGVRREGTAGAPDLSVIITCYFEERSIDEFHSRLSSALLATGLSYEIVFVNDGSTDGTFERLKAIYAKDENVTTIVDLFRNAGQASAITAGITCARGAHFVFMDSDLQLSPEELPLLLGPFAEGIDIVSGVRTDRKDSLLRTLMSKIANQVMRRVSGHAISDFGCTFKIYDGKLIRAFEFGPYRKFQTAYVYSRAQTAKEVPVTHKARKYGKSGWTFRSLSAFMMDNVVGLSRRPFQLLSILCLAAAALFGMRILLAWTVPVSILPQITTGLILNVLIVHLLVTVAILAAIGEYVIRNFVALQSYPAYIVREKHQKPDALET